MNLQQQKPTFTPTIVNNQDQSPEEMEMDNIQSPILQDIAVNKRQPDKKDNLLSFNESLNLLNLKATLLFNMTTALIQEQEGKRKICCFTFTKPIKTIKAVPLSHDVQDFIQKNEFDLKHCYKILDSYNEPKENRRQMFCELKAICDKIDAYELQNEMSK